MNPSFTFLRPPLKKRNHIAVLTAAIVVTVIIAILKCMHELHINVLLILQLIPGPPWFPASVPRPLAVNPSHAPKAPSDLCLPHVHPSYPLTYPSLHSVALVAELVGIGGGRRPRPQSTGADRGLLTGRGKPLSANGGTTTSPRPEPQRRRGRGSTIRPPLLQLYP